MLLWSYVTWPYYYHVNTNQMYYHLMIGSQQTNTSPSLLLPAAMLILSPPPHFCPFELWSCLKTLHTTSATWSHVTSSLHKQVMSVLFEQTGTSARQEWSPRSNDAYHREQQPGMCRHGYKPLCFHSAAVCWRVGGSLWAKCSLFLAHAEHALTRHFIRYSVLLPATADPLLLSLDWGL